MRKKLLTSLMGLLAVLYSFLATGQSRIINGTVTDTRNGEPLAGVTVLVKGTQTVSSTDGSGKYRIQSNSANDVIVFRMLGMKTKEISAAAGPEINVSMESDALNLSETVVTALGVEREKKALGYSAQSVGGQELRRSGEVNIVQSLAGKAAGVQIVGSSGTPGASSKILIRGNSTFTGENQPLFVIDGVPMDNSTSSSVAGDYPFNPTLNGVNNSNRALDINPDDIEDITVLKGPAAAALYGVRAGNGAVVITTKRGRGGRGKNYEVQISSSVEMSEVNKLPELQSKYAQGNGGGRFIGGVYQNGTYSTANPGPDGVWNTDDDVLGTANSWGPAINNVPELGGKSYDNMSDFFQTGYTYNNNISVSGGSDRGSFRLSLGRTDQTGVVPNTQLKRTTIRLTADHRLSDKLSVFGTVNYTNSNGIKAQNGSNLSGVMLSLTRAPASFSLKGEGDNGWLFPNGQQRQYFGVYDNPYWTAFRNPHTDNVNRILGNIALNYKPASYMDITYRLGTDVYTDNRKQVFAIGSWDPPTPTGEVWNNTKTYSEIYSDLLITLKKQLNESLMGTLTLGNNLNNRQSRDEFARGRNLSVPNFYNMTNASDRFASESDQVIRTAALFYDAHLDIKNYLYLATTGRLEYSSTFGTSQNNFFFPSVSASFVFTEFIKENDILSFGKVRAAVAQSGISPSPYTSRTYFRSPLFTDGFTDGISFPFNGLNGFGYTSNGVIGNPNLRPEILTGYDLGLDLRFLKGRLNLDLTYYYQQTDDIIVTRPVAGSTGFTNYVQNAGSMRNHGIELVLTGTPIKSKNLSWDITVNFNANRNKVLDLGEGLKEIQIDAAFGDINAFAIKDQPYGVLYGTRWLRNSANGALLINPNTGLPYLDPINGNIGNPYPDWLMGIRNTVNYKNFSLSFLIDIRQGGAIWNGTYARLNRIGRTEASADRERQYVIPGEVATVDGNGNIVSTGQQNGKLINALDYYARYVGDNGSAREQSVEDGSWVRLRDVVFTYSLKFKNNSTLRALDFSVTGRNLLLFTNYSGVDPETSLTGAGSNIGGFDYFNMPGTRSYIFSVRATF